MSVGGIVVNVINCNDRLWINTRERNYPNDEGTAIYVKKPNAEKMPMVGDMVWWQGNKAFWTPRGATENKDIEIELERSGYSHGEFDWRQCFSSRISQKRNY